MTAAARMTGNDRRARLVDRHRLARTATDPLDVVRSIVAMHSTDPSTPYLGTWARMRRFTTEHLDAALLGERTLWRLHAMRRTLFVVPTDEAHIFDAAASRDVAHKERAQLVKWLAAEMDPSRVERWLADVEASVVAAISAHPELRTQDLTAAVPELTTQVTLGSGKWTTRSPISSRLLFVLALDGRIVRTRAAGTWRSNQYWWAAADTWFDEPRPHLEPEAARPQLLQRYIARHGPVTVTDMRWWTKWTVRQVAATLAELDVAEVRLDDDSVGYVLADDVEPAVECEPTVALLPALDPTPMGWKERDWYLGAHTPRLFDSNGNVGPTVWVDGRVVGGWGQRPDGEVVVRLLEDVAREAAAQVDEEAARLTRWLDGVVTIPRFRTPLEQELCRP